MLPLKLLSECSFGVSGAGPASSCFPTTLPIVILSFLGVNPAASASDAAGEAEALNTEEQALLGGDYSWADGSTLSG